MTNAQHDTINRLRSLGYSAGPIMTPRGDHVLVLVRRRLRKGMMLLRIYPDGRYVDPINQRTAPAALEVKLWQNISS